MNKERGHTSRGGPPDSDWRFSVSPSFMLVVVTFLWGLSFPLMKNWQDASESCPKGKAVAALTLIPIRMFIALLIFGVLRPQLFLAPSRREYRAGFLLGSVFFL